MPDQETIDMIQRTAIKAVEAAQVALDRAMALQPDPEDDFEDGAILNWRRTWSSAPYSQIYSYVAIKCNGKWWVSGKASSLEAKQGLSWSSFYNGWLRHALYDEVYIVTMMEEL